MNCSTYYLVSATVADISCTFFIHADLFLTLSDNKYDKIQTEHVLISDVRQVICWHVASTHQSKFDWYYHMLSSDVQVDIQKEFGWYIKAQRALPFNKRKLIKNMSSTAIEGFFICDTGVEQVSVWTHYPSKVVSCIAHSILFLYKYPTNVIIRHTCIIRLLHLLLVLMCSLQFYPLAEV